MTDSLASVTGLAEILLIPDREPDPHPALVAVQKPTAAQMTEAVGHLGLYPSRPLFVPVRLADGSW